MGNLCHLYKRWIRTNIHNVKNSINKTSGKQMIQLIMDYGSEQRVLRTKWKMAKRFLKKKCSILLENRDNGNEN